MRKVLRGYTKDRNGNLIVIGTIVAPHSKDKRSPKNVKRNGIWSDKAQPSLRKKLFVSNNPTRDATIAGPYESGIKCCRCMRRLSSGEIKRASSAIGRQRDEPPSGNAIGRGPGVREFPIFTTEQSECTELLRRLATDQQLMPSS
jgi:hypothetical protein